MNNIKFYITLLMLIFTTSCSAQLIESKDGVSLGKRSDFISSCVSGAKNSLIEINGIQFDSYKYCSCVCDNLIPRLYYWEIEKALREKSLMKLFSEERNLRIIIKCVEANIKNID